MPEYAYELYESIVSATSSDLILFFIILAVVAIPLYVAVLKGRKSDKEHERKREQQFIEVIKENSSVIAGLKITLENNGDLATKALVRIHTRLDEQAVHIKEMGQNIAQVNTKFDRSFDNQKEMASKLNKVFVMTSGGNLPPNTENQEGN